MSTSVFQAGRRRASALLLIGAFLLVQLAGFLHLATERHEVCPDHGELVHASAGHEAGARPGGREGHVLEGASAPVAHAHCGSLPAMLPKGLPPACAGLASLPSPAATAQATHPSQGARSSVPLLLQAPKLSPPV